MIKICQKIITSLFYAIAFFTPLILWPHTSEIFEFNKMVFIYISTLVICTFWILKMIWSRKINFVRTPLDLPLLIFLGTNIISTFFSIDIRTSIFGYYSRFNGGLFSTISYLLLYWTFVSNMDRVRTKKFILFLLLASLFVATYGVAQHFGIDKNIWADDVTNRVFSTLGQPNWLAAWMVALIPLAWLFSIKTKVQKKVESGNRILKIISVASSTLLFPTLLFTKSRSGIIAFAFIYVIFWLIYFLKSTVTNKNLKFPRITYVIFSCLYLLLVVYFGSPWTTALENKNISQHDDATQRNVTSILESGSSGSGQIRKIVWQGALSIWQSYPLFGSGVETFAYTYQQIKPAEHNLTAEWDYIYNKAHNEYLNYLSTTGVLGLASYLLVILFSLVQISNLKFESLSLNKMLQHVSGVSTFNFALLTGFVSLLITNFFGFSVVPTSLLFFLFPAVAITINMKASETKFKKLNLILLTMTVAVLITSSCLIFYTLRYWYADYLFAQTNKYLEMGNIEIAQKKANDMLQLSPNEPHYRAILSQIYAQSALILYKNENTEQHQNYLGLARDEAQKAIQLSPANVYFVRNLASIDLLFSSINPKYLLDAKDDLNDAVKLAPTDAKLFYNLGLIHLKLGELDNAEEILKYTVTIKANYAEARYALALVYYNLEKENEAKQELNHILNKIDPNYTDALELLEEIK